MRFPSTGPLTASHELVAALQLPAALLDDVELYDRVRLIQKGEGTDAGADETTIELQSRQRATTPPLAHEIEADPSGVTDTELVVIAFAKVGSPGVFALCESTANPKHHYFIRLQANHCRLQPSSPPVSATDALWRRVDLRQAGTYLSGWMRDHPSRKRKRGAGKAAAPAKRLRSKGTDVDAMAGANPLDPEATSVNSESASAAADSLVQLAHFTRTCSQCATTVKIGESSVFCCSRCKDLHFCEDCAFTDPHPEHALWLLSRAKPGNGGGPSRTRKWFPCTLTSCPRWDQEFDSAKSANEHIMSHHTTHLPLFPSSGERRRFNFTERQVRIAMEREARRTKKKTGRKATPGKNSKNSSGRRDDDRDQRIRQLEAKLKAMENLDPEFSSGQHHNAKRRRAGSDIGSTRKRLALAPTAGPDKELIDVDANNPIKVMGLAHIYMQQCLRIQREQAQLVHANEKAALEESLAVERARSDLLDETAARRVKERETKEANMEFMKKLMAQPEFMAQFIGSFGVPKSTE